MKKSKNYAWLAILFVFVMAAIPSVLPSILYNKSENKIVKREASKPVNYADPAQLEQAKKALAKAVLIVRANLAYASLMASRAKCVIVARQMRAVFVRATKNQPLPKNRENNMNLSYSITAKENSLRRLHIIIIDGERLGTTRQKEILIFARSRISSKYDWKQLKDAVRLGESLETTQTL